MNALVVVLILLILLCGGGYWGGLYGDYPFGGLLSVLVLLLILKLLGVF